MVSAVLFLSSWCQLFACLIRAAIFRLPSSFVVLSFFLCNSHLWSVPSFFATGICVQPLSFRHGLFCRRHSCRPFVFALSALAGGYQCTFFFFLYHAMRLPLVSRVRVSNFTTLFCLDRLSILHIVALSVFTILPCPDTSSYYLYRRV